MTDRVFFCAPGKWDLYQCANCGCAYLDPRPTRNTIHLAYREYYTHAPPPVTDSSTFRGLRRFRHALGNGFRNWRFGTKAEPASRLGIVIAWFLPRKRRELERDFRNLSRPSPGARLLDVGFGSAAFLDIARSAGWQVAGADPDPVTVDSARKRGLDVRQGGIEAFEDSPGSFDVITLSHVIEHVHDPRALTRQTFNLLKPGGSAWIETPNIDSYGHLRFGCHWRGLEPPRHLALFNWEILESMLRSEGFRIGRRLPQHHVYAELAMKSYALRRGWIPSDRPAPRLAERMTNLLLGLGSRLNYRRSEYVTLLATKPLA